MQNQQEKVRCLAEHENGYGFGSSRNASDPGPGQFGVLRKKELYVFVLSAAM